MSTIPNQRTLFCTQGDCSLQKKLEPWLTSADGRGDEACSSACPVMSACTLSLVLSRVTGLCYAQVTKVKLAQKQKEGIAEARSGRRTPASAQYNSTLFHLMPYNNPLDTTALFFVTAPGMPYINSSDTQHYSPSGCTTVPRWQLCSYDLSGDVMRVCNA
jgi:hypothetical protein